MSNIFVELKYWQFQLTASKLIDQISPCNGGWLLFHIFIHAGRTKMVGIVRIGFFFFSPLIDRGHSRCLHNTFTDTGTGSFCVFVQYWTADIDRLTYAFRYIQHLPWWLMHMSRNDWWIFDLRRNPWPAHARSNLPSYTVHLEWEFALIEMKLWIFFRNPLLSKRLRFSGLAIEVCSAKKTTKS